MNLNKNTLANALMALGKFVSRMSPMKMYRSMLITSQTVEMVILAMKQRIQKIMQLLKGTVLADKTSA